MIKDSRFDDIRPFYEDELPAALQRITESEFFPMLASYIYPGKSIAEVKDMMLSFRTFPDFQLEVMKCVNEQVIARSTDGLTYAGMEHLNPDTKYLFVSNHRDIVLDSCLLQYLLYKNGHETTEITFGANLMMNPLIIDIGKANKMFKVERPGGSIKDFYRASQHLSDYIRYVITRKGESVWIAQRNGRTKDGKDATDPGIIKMFCMSRSDNKVEALDELHIVPVSISYEWESCDILKTLERYEARFAKYIKKPGEDLNSILTGIIQKKGCVHIELCKPITRSELEALDHLTSNEYHRAVAALLDNRINGAFRLYPNNYIAHDLLYANNKYAKEYTDAQKEAFLQHLQELNKYEDADQETLKDLLLSIYANPVDNKPTQTS